MNRFIVSILAASLALGACSSNTPPSVVPASGDNAVRSAPVSFDVTGPGRVAAASKKHGKLVKTAFFMTVPKRKPGRHHRKRGADHPNYISPSSQSIVITLVSVNGQPPPSGLLLTATTNLSNCSSGCTVFGPAVPPAQDAMTLQMFDGLNGSGHVLSQASPTFTVTPATANTLSVVLAGVPNRFSFTSVPTGAAGTAFGSNGQSVAIDVLDYDGNPITGTYASPVTLTDGDSAGASKLTLNGGTPATSVQSGTSDDAIALQYSGLAIASPDLTATASGATTGSATFTVSSAVPASVCGDGGAVICGTTPSNPTVNLYTTSGAGSSATLTTTQTGWSGSPYLRDVSESDNCAAIANVSQTSSTNPSGIGTVFTVSTNGVPNSAGSCTVTLTGGAQQAEAVTVTYTTAGIGVH